MNCPYCDMFTPEGKKCQHCGEKLPVSKEENTVNYSSASPRKESSGLFTKIIITIIAGVCCGVGYFYFFTGVPSYMNEGPLMIEDRIVTDRINIVDFYSDYCPPCRQIAPYLVKLDQADPDIVVVKININRPGIKGIDWQSPIVKQFKIKSIPYFLVFNKNGELTHKGIKANKFIEKAMQKNGIR